MNFIRTYCSRSIQRALTGARQPGTRGMRDWMAQSTFQPPRFEIIAYHMWCVLHDGVMALASGHGRRAAHVFSGSMGGELSCCSVALGASSERAPSVESGADGGVAEGTHGDYRLAWRVLSPP